MIQTLEQWQRNASKENEIATYASESVTEGHPDKLCDGISDAVLDAALSQDPHAHVACEVAAFRDGILICGEITGNVDLDLEQIARDKASSIGYEKNQVPGFDAASCEVLIRVSQQSPNINNTVNRSFEVRKFGSTDMYDVKGAGDQGFAYGGACRQTTSLMPLPHSLAHGVAKQLTFVRKQGNGLGALLRPDGKSQVVVEYNDQGQPEWVSAVIVAAQHAYGLDPEALHDFVVEHVIKPVIPSWLIRPSTAFFVNSSGEFYYGGPASDSGLTGRKIIVDTYGGMFRHGGGAFSGKDPSKVDRCAAYYVRWIAKNLVYAGLADTIELQASYTIGKARPLSINIKTFGTNKIPKADIRTIIERNFDFRPAAMIERLDLLLPIYEPTSAYGHFGPSEYPWEQIITLDM